MRILHVLKTVIQLLFHLLVPKWNRVFFSSFSGLYNDNPLYVSEELHRRDESVEIYWVISEKSRETNLPVYIKTVRPNTWKYCYYLNRSKFVVENGVGIQYLFCTKAKEKLYQLLKNRKQFDISTWHGTPLKTIGSDTNWDSGKVFVTSSDYFATGCRYNKEIFERAFNGKLNIHMIGTPRNDILVNITPEDRARIRKRLGFGKYERIVIYAPTFRDDIYGSGAADSFDYLMNMNVPGVTEALTRRFGGTWAFVFRGHQFVQEHVRLNKYQGRADVRIVDGNQFDDMAQYLAVCNILITDYSGSLFDFALTGRPCFLYTPDRQAYVRGRKIYDSFGKFPYNICDTNEQLIAAIRNFSYPDFKRRLDMFQRKIGNMEEGKAAERIVDIILEKMYGGRPAHQKPEGRTVCRGTKNTNPEGNLQK